MSIEKFDWLNDIYYKINFNNLPHGIIINGPSGVGKKILAKQISKKILSNFEEKLNSQHQNLFETNNHPDYFYLKKDKVLIHHISCRDNKWDEELGKRNVLDFLTLTPSISKNKVAVITNGETMRDESQNALLKSLEEPAPNTYIIILTNRPNSLKKTIYSRCQILNIPYISSNKINEWLHDSGITDYSSTDFPSYATPLTILDDIQSDTQNSYKEFICVINQFLNLKIDQGQAIKSINDLDINFISKINYLVEFLKIILKSKLTNESLSGTYENFNSKKFSNLKISNIIVELNDLRHDFYDVSSINETHVLNYFCSELKQSIRQQ
jgi:DNA polymerase III delta prime subunit